MAPENELLSSWREELRQQASQGPGREELEGGGEEQEGEIEMLDENSNVERTVTDSESESHFREALRQEKYRKKKRQRSGEDGGGDEIDAVPGNIPVDLLRRISPLCEKLGLSMRQQLALTMGFAELCGE